MPDIDSLSIQITSSTQGATQSINALIRNLGNLNAALNNYSADSPYIKGFNSLVSGLNGISSAVKSIDIDKIKNLSSVLGSLGTSGEKISKLNNVKVFSNMGADLSKFSAEAKSMAQDFAKEFNIPQKEMVKLTSAIQKMHEATSDSSFESAMKEAEELALKYKKLDGFAKEVAESEKEMRAELSKSKIYLSSNVMSNYGDDAKSLRGKIGIQNTTTNINNGTDIVTAAAEMGTYRDNSYEAAEALRDLATSEADVLNGSETIHNVSGFFQELRDKVVETKAAVDDLDGEMLSLDNVDFEFFDDNVTTKANQTLSAIQNVNQSMETLRSEMTTEIGNPFEGLITGLESLKGIEIPAEKFAGVATLASSLSKFGGKNATAALTVIPQVGRAFAQMAAELAQAPQISENLIRLAEAMSQFTRSGERASKTAVTFGTVVRNSFKDLPHLFNSLFHTTNKTHRSFGSLAAVIGRVYANFFLLIRGIRLLGKAMSYSSQLTEVQNVVATTFGNMADKMEDFSQNAIQSFGLAELSAKQFGSRFQAMGSAMGITSKDVTQANEFISEALVGQKREVDGLTDSYADLGDSLADMSINLTKLTSDYASFYDQDFEDVAQDMQAIFTGMTRPLRKYGLDLTQATLKEFALANGLDSDIEKMTQAEKTLLRYQYVMAHSGKVMNDFAITANTFANILRVIQQEFIKLGGIIGTALVNTFKPLLIQFRDFFNSFIGMTEKALNALGKLLGWQISLEQVGLTMDEDMGDYADSLDDAAGAAKKLKGQLRGIDELNNLTSNNGGGGGGGASALGGGSALNGGGLSFLEVPKNYESDVKDWYDFGYRISKAFKEGLDSIDWNSIYEKFGNFGKNLASFLNGIIQPDTFRSIGKTIMGALNSVVIGLKEFAKEFDFKNFGVSLAEIINGFFEEWRPEDWAEAINGFVNGFWDALNGFFKGDDNGEGGLDYNLIGNKIGIFLSKLEWKSWVTIIGGLTIKVATALAPFALKFMNELWKVFKKPIKEFLKKTIWPEVVAFFNEIAANPAGLIKTFTNLGKAIVSAIIAGLGGYTIGNGIGEIFALLAGDNEMAEQYENSSLLSLFGVDMDLWEESWFETFDDIKDGWSLFKSDMEDNKFQLSDIFVQSGDLSETYEKIGKSIDEFLDGTEKSFSDWWNNTVSPTFDLPKWVSLTETIPQSLKQVWEEAVAFWTTEVPKWWNDEVAPWFTKEKWTEIFDNIREALKTVWEGTVGDWILKTNEFIEQEVKPKFTKEYWVSFLSGIRDAFGQIWDDAKQLAKGFFNSMADFVEQFINGAIDGFGALAAAKSLLSEVNIDFNIPHISIPRFANGGYPSTGSLFWAGEAGAEIVGSVNGKTAVTSNGEITGIADAIRSTSETEIGLLRQQNTLLQGILEKEFGISNDDLFRSVRSSARDFTNRTGSPAF